MYGDNGYVIVENMGEEAAFSGQSGHKREGVALKTKYGNISCIHLA
jgi:hypothetical protein